MVIKKEVIVRVNLSDLVEHNILSEDSATWLTETSEMNNCYFANIETLNHYLRCMELEELPQEELDVKADLIKLKEWMQVEKVDEIDLDFSTFS